MKILAHRGAWHGTRFSPNSREALLEALEMGFGIETDIRNAGEKLVVNHDATSTYDLTFRELLDFAKGSNQRFAFNVKASELSPLVKAYLHDLSNMDYFFFDFAVPDLRKFLESDIRSYTRISEVETSLFWEHEIAGVWLDSFNNTVSSASQIATFLEKGLEVSLVSGELHGHDHLPQWELARLFRENSLFSVCTDYPVQLREFVFEVPFRR